MRLRLVWAMAARLPISSDADGESTASICCQSDGQRQHAPAPAERISDGEGRQFGRATDHQRDGGRCAVVDVGYPHVERHHAQLERQTGHHEHQAQHQHAGAIRPGWPHHQRWHLHDLRSDRASRLRRRPWTCRRAGSRTGQRTEHKILHGRFTGRYRIVTTQRHQRVAGQRQQLQAQVDHQEVVDPRS